jgi:hypothetical protein
MGLPQQIKTISATKVNTTALPGGSRSSYECANPYITRGITTAPDTYQNCIQNQIYGTKISSIVNALGVNPSNLWSGPPALSGTPAVIKSTFIGQTSPECDSVESIGDNWLGCFWSAPDSVLSCRCPEIGENYENYLKLRLNVATFWNTPVETPILRKRFLDSINYGKKVTFSVAGDFTVKPGNIVELYVGAISGYSQNITSSTLSKKYYVISVKNTVLNSGVHETTIVAVEPLY